MAAGIEHVSIGACAVPCASDNVARVVTILAAPPHGLPPTTILWVAEVLNRDVASTRHMEAEAAHDGRIPAWPRSAVAEADRAAEDCRQRRLMMEAA